MYVFQLSATHSLHSTHVRRNECLTLLWLPLCRQCCTPEPTNKQFYCATTCLRHILHGGLTPCLSTKMEITAFEQGTKGSGVVILSLTPGRLGKGTEAAGRGSDGGKAACPSCNKRLNVGWRTAAVWEGVRGWIHFLVVP